MEPDECLFLSSAGGRGDAGAGSCPFAPATAIGVPDAARASRAKSTRQKFARWSAASLLRQCRACASSPKVQDARLRRTVGRDHGDRYAVTDAKQRLFRYGVQVDSLGLTEQQPENNVYAYSARNAGGDTVEERARPCRAIAGLERGARPAAAMGPAMVAAHAADLAYETDLLEYGDIFDGSAEIEPRSLISKAGAGRNSRTSTRWAARSRRSIRLHEAAAGRIEHRRIEAIERGEQIVVGVNRFTETEPSPLTAAGEVRSSSSLPGSKPSRSRGCRPGAPRATEGGAAALEDLHAGGRKGRQHHGALDRGAKAGATTGEWGFALRARFGEYRAPTGVGTRHAQRRRRPRRHPRRGRPGVEKARPAAEIFGRQTRPRRPFQRRRTDRRARPRRRHGRGL